MSKLKEVLTNTERSHLETRAFKKASKLGEFIRERTTAYLENNITIHVEGQKNLEKLGDSGAIVVIAPHNGHPDSPLVRAAFEEQYRKHLFLIGAADYWDKAVFAEDDSLGKRIKKTLTVACMKRLGPAFVRIFPIDRFNSEQSYYDLAQIAQLVLDGEYAAILPEGTRNRNVETPMTEREFKTGLGLLVMMTEGKVPILPVYLEGNEKLLPAHKKWPEFQEDGIPHTVTVHIGEPIDTSSLVEKSLLEMEDPEIRAKRRMITNLVFGYFTGMFFDINGDDINSNEPY